MGYIDRVPRAGNLTIGGLAALYRLDLMRQSGVSHVLSVIDYDVKVPPQLRGLRHLHITADDEPRQDLLQYFDRTNAFIDEALSRKDDGGVFVHCAMGKSRSATLVCAYLMWKYGLTPEQALVQLCEGRPICEPNEAFREQLEVYGNMLKVSIREEKDRIYKEWEKSRFRGNAWEWDSTSRVKL